MKLTVVTATFNCIRSGNGDNLVRCIESVAKLKTPHEHLIYDGASVDGTVDLIHKHQAPGVKLVSEPDTGIYNALNKGVRDAQGEWFYVLGADDCIFAPEVLDEIIEAHAGNCDEIVSDVVRQDKTTGRKVLKYIFCTPPYCHQGILMRTDEIRKRSGFDERYRICADYDLVLKFHQDGMRISYCDKPFTVYGVSGFSGMDSEKLRDNCYQVSFSHFGVSHKEWEIIEKYNVLPFRLVKRYFNHPDKALRASARKSIPMFFLAPVCFCLYSLMAFIRRLCGNHP